jgi:hypothetical protein
MPGGIAGSQGKWAPAAFIEPRNQPRAGYQINGKYRAVQFGLD